MYIRKNFDVESLKGRLWYHQAFDMCPMFAWFIADAEVRKESRKPKGTEADERVMFAKGGRGDWYLDMKDVKRGADAIIKIAKKDPNTSKKLLAKWERDEKKFDDFFYKVFPKINLEKLSDKELGALWEKYRKLSLNRFTSSSVIDHFALGTDEIIGNLLRKELKGKFTKESEFTNFFSIATAPTRQSFINQAEIELLKIILGDSTETLEDYQKRWYWSKNNYFRAQKLSLKYFEEEISSWKSTKKNLRIEMERIENTPRVNEERKKEFFKKNKISPLLKNLIKISDDFTWWQDARKRATYFNIEIGSSILDEIGKRKGYKLSELKYALGGEISSILKNKKPSKNELRKREKECVIIATGGGNYIAMGKELEKIKKIVLGEKGLFDLKDFRGLSASVGRVTGPVKIVKSATEIGKVKQGDILVAVMTRPDYVVAMKKAAAIVTNEGGITSHAAIVSRELGIPCIIGTKIATEVLKDGDIVEVNANHGVVNILKR